MTDRAAAAAWMPAFAGMTGKLWERRGSKMLTPGRSAYIE
jgi:hypothetical protein